MDVRCWSTRLMVKAESVGCPTDGPLGEAAAEQPVGRDGRAPCAPPCSDHRGPQACAGQGRNSEVTGKATSVPFLLVDLDGCGGGAEPVLGILGGRPRDLAGRAGACNRTAGGGI